MDAGVRLYGKVDQVASEFYVATLFVHSGLIPLWPLRTYLVRSGTESKSNSYQEFEGYPVAFSWKSLAFAWARCLLIAAVGVGLIGPEIYLLMGGPPRPLPPEPWHIPALLTTAAVAFGFLWASYRVTRAGPERAAALRSVWVILSEAGGSKRTTQSGRPAGHKQRQRR